MAELVSNVVAYIVIGKKKVFLSIEGNKFHNTLVKNLIKTIETSSTETKVLGGNEFKLRLEINPNTYSVNAYISSPLLPTKDEYLVMNFYENSAISIISEVENDKGVFPEDKVFEAIFNFDSGKGYEVSFVCSDMTNYKQLEEEMTRVFYASVGKKTRKWKPGHRYDSEKETYYYLGEFGSRKIENYNSGFFKDCPKVVHLYVNTLKEGEKKVSDIFNNRVFDNDSKDGIKVLWDEKFPSCVDSGQKLEDDLPSLSQYYIPMIEKVYNTEGLDNTSKLLVPLCYKSLHDSDDFSKDVCDFIKNKIISGLIYNTVYNNWNIVRADESYKIGKDVEHGNNVERIVRALISNIKDYNVASKSYYLDLFKNLSINLSTEVSEFLSDSWDEDSLKEDFDSFRENVKYFNRRGNRIVLNQQSENLEDKKKISNIFPCELGDVIKKLVNYSLNNYGDGVSVFDVSKFGRLEEVKCKITLEDILNFRDTKEIREELFSYLFTEICIYFYKNQGVE